MSATVAPPLRRSPGWVLVRSLSNLLLGFALGILSYYLITDIVTRREQDELSDELSDMGAVGSPSPDRLLGGDEGVFDWGGWEAEDLAYWESLPDGGVFGRLVIEGADVDVVVLKGTTREILKRGPGWITYTDPPGPVGNAAISGHRTTYGAPFRRLDRLGAGDTIYFYSPFRRYAYDVTESFSVTPDRVDVVASTPEPRLTLTACDPPYSARYRLIIWADLVEVRRFESGPVESGA